MLLTVLAPLPDRCPALASSFEISPTNDDGADSMDVSLRAHERGRVLRFWLQVLGFQKLDTQFRHATAHRARRCTAALALNCLDPLRLSAVDRVGQPGMATQSACMLTRTSSGTLGYLDGLFGPPWVIPKASLVPSG